MKLEDVRSIAKLKGGDPAKLSKTIQGERKQEKEERGRKFYRVECSHGSFVRSFRVPGDADESAIKAEFKDGMLNITLPKSEKAKPKSINVSVS